MYDSEKVGHIYGITVGVLSGGNGPRRERGNRNAFCPYSPLLFPPAAELWSFWQRTVYVIAIGKVRQHSVPSSHIGNIYCVLQAIRMHRELVQNSYSNRGRHGAARLHLGFIYSGYIQAGALLVCGLLC